MPQQGRGSLHGDISSLITPASAHWANARGQPMRRLNNNNAVHSNFRGRSTKQQQDNWYSKDLMSL
jgi:hypothetical protein